MAEPGDGGFLSRWSRLKQRPTEAAPEPVEPAVPEEAAAEPPGPATAGPEEPPPLPDPDTLEHDADWSVFLRKDAPGDLQRRALRRLWRMDPVYANLDGLVDYDDDFHDPKFTTGIVKTLFQVGRGMVLPEADEAKPPDAPVEAVPAEAPDPGLPPAATPEPALSAPDPEVSVAADQSAGPTRVAVGREGRKPPGRAAGRRWGTLSGEA